MQRLARLLPLPFLLLAPALQAAPEKAPRISDSQIARPLPLPYDVAADGGAQFRTAMARAKASHKLLLVDLGGNWCLDCRVLAGAMEIPALHAFIARHYELVSIDIGRRDKNLEIPTRYGITLEGVPALLVIEPRHGKLINKDQITALSDARSMAAQSLADWLAQWL